MQHEGRVSSVASTEGDPDLEISDLIVDYQLETLQRIEVSKDAVLDYFEQHGNRRAQRIVRSLPSSGGILDPDAVDHALIVAHMELQRLHEEFVHGDRVLRLLRPALRVLQRRGVPPPWRVVDIGCGLGYTVRWLTSRGGLGPQVQLIGVDYNAGLVHCAQRVGESEGLRCDFRVGNAFRLDEPATVFISTGAAHHFRGAALERFFASQSSAHAFLHFDLVPTWLTPLGAWLFHRARMRSGLARHDGPLSAARAHSGKDLLEASRRVLPDFTIELFDGEVGTVPLTRVFHCVVGIRREYAHSFREALGPHRRRLGATDSGSAS